LTGATQEMQRDPERYRKNYDGKFSGDMMKSRADTGRHGDPEKIWRKSWEIGTRYERIWKRSGKALEEIQGDPRRHMEI
jgi:hypothetical protein